MFIPYNSLCINAIQIIAFSGVLNLAPALAAICKGSEYSSWSLEHGLSLCSAILNVWAYPLTTLWLIPQVDHQGDSA